MCLFVNLCHFNLKYYTLIENGISGNPAIQIANLSYMMKSVTEFLRFFSVLTVIFLVTDLFKNNELKIKSNSKIVVAFIVFIAYEIFFSRIQVGLNFAIEINSGSMDLYVIIIRNIQAFNLLIKSLFYVTLSLFILIVNSKIIKGKIGLRLMFIFWMILYTIIPIAYFLQKEDLMIISSYVCVGILSIVIILYLLIFYFRKTNKIISEEY